MQISKDTAITLRLKVADAQGQVIQDGKQPTAYLHGGYGNLIDTLETELEGKAVGFKGRWRLSPAEAFGERDETLMQTIPKTNFPPGVKVGGQLEGRTADGREAVFTVVKIKGPQVILDGNHPLAGKTLDIAAKVVELRAATAEEIAHGHVHGAAGHQH
ncbi:MAG: peptidylprolyl isomerase [Betaproteobacteria bacterium]|nr:peptidylprolyl isomerase [Betaproteobacteria bacterium]